MVTGAGSGIGRALADALAGHGARLAIADWDRSGLEETARLIETAGGEVLASRVDVSDRAAVAAFAREVVARFGVVHQVYNNAGIAGGGTTVAHTGYEAFERVLGVNLWGVIHGTKEFLPHLIASGDGHVVNVSSLNGFLAQPGLAPYVTSKFGVRGFTEALRTEMLAEGLPVAVTVVHPGGVRTNIARSAYGPGGADIPAEHLERVRVYEERLFRTPAEEAARLILAAVARKRGRVLIAQAAAVDRLVRLFPESYPRLVVTWGRRLFGSW
ncbi:SDR family NAD(P)-dependent oxidoreductase [Naasia aerilata]|uniref:SDR family NAD(P)-dependent oxidoreductase n=1 Tax=Naasia aerilata TaxID=1162966 RepID=UPI0025725CFC|nr:SDR family NAD(P)-dependent oxidoreductase [Naasia aerilata]